MGRGAEVQALRQRAETLHPRGREAAAHSTWRARWDVLAADADRLSDGAYFVRTRQALGWFKDGHTTLLPFEFTGGTPAQLAQGPFALSLPIGVRVFHDGAYVTSAKGEAAPLLGARLTRVGAADIVALMRAWAADWPGNDAWAHRWAGTMFSPAFLKALVAIEDPASPVRIEAVHGRRTLHVSLRPSADGGDSRQALARTKTQVEFWSDAAGEAASGNFVRRVGAAIYISCDELGAEIEPFGAFTRSCFEAMDNPEPTRLVLDLRRNGGGNNYLFEALRKHVGALTLQSSWRTLYLDIAANVLRCAERDQSA